MGIEMALFQCHTRICGLVYTAYDCIFRVLHVLYFWNVNDRKRESQSTKRYFFHWIGAQLDFQFRLNPEIRGIRSRVYDHGHTDFCRINAAFICF